MTLQFKHTDKDLRCRRCFSGCMKNQINYAQEFLVNAPLRFPMSQYYRQPNRQNRCKAFICASRLAIHTDWTAVYLCLVLAETRRLIQGGLSVRRMGYHHLPITNGLYHPGTPGTPFQHTTVLISTNGMGAFVGPSAYGRIWSSGTK